ncbi:hypothetical protein RQP46_001299 [Phenoliferia psychrophenolica]
MHLHPIAPLALSLSLLSAVLASSNAHLDPLADDMVRRATPETYNNGTSAGRLTRTRREVRGEAVAAGVDDLKKKKRSCNKRHNTSKAKKAKAAAQATLAAQKAWVANPKNIAGLGVGVSIGDGGISIGLGGATATASSSAPTPTKTSGPFKLTQDYSGSSFMDGWDFFNYPDPTHGQVNYVDGNTAYAKNLVEVTSDDTTILRVDNSSWLDYGANRDSVRITSKKTFSEGSLVIFDAVRMPYGPTTWPAFWSVGQNWPAGGEIDIVEQVQNSVQNQMTLHTTSGCTLAQPMAATGDVLVENCDGAVNGNTGCGVLDTSTKSYGSAFNAVGGGVFAMHWDAYGISIWSFERSKIPADISAGYPAFDNWGQPSANWASSTCSMDHFGDQTLVFDITLCGDWASAVPLPAGISGTCMSNVQNPANYDNALFEINSVKVYSPN